MERQTDHQDRGAASRTENTLEDRGAASSSSLSSSQQSRLNRSPAPAMLWLAGYPTVTSVTVESLAPAMLRLAVDGR